MGRLQFSDLFFTELPVPPQAGGVFGTFNVLDIYPSELIQNDNIIVYIRRVLRNIKSVSTYMFKNKSAYLNGR